MTMNNLWKEECDVYIDLFKNIKRDYPDAYIAMAEFDQLKKFRNIPIKCRKNNRMSSDYREQGNKRFKEQKWLEAMDLYNESLCTAEIGTENVSMAYANRSAVFFHLKMYEKCIVDIQLASETGYYPTQLVPKLEKRLAECTKLLNAGGQCKEFVPKLSFEADENFPGMANVLRIESNNKFGRHIIATTNIDVGKTVLIEEEYVMATTISADWKNCLTCLKLTTNLIPCDHCTVAMFCCRTCVEMNQFHEMECGYDHLDMHDYGHQVLRSIFIALQTFSTTEELINFVRDTLEGGEEKGKVAPSSIVNPITKYRTFLNLNIFLSSENKTKMVPEIYKVYKRLLAYASIETMFETTEKQRFLMHLVGHHICIIISNSFAIKYLDTDQCSLSLIKSHFNHSCAPNLLHFTKGNRVICITSRQIKQGDQLFIVYMEDLPRANRYREQRLLESFGFQCNCEKCGLCNRSIDSNRIKFDPEFQYLVERFQVLSEDHRNDSISLEVKNLCIKFLNKYGSLPWNDEVDAISDNFYKLLSNEIRN